MSENPAAHPDFGELEAYRRGEADEITARHVARCAECRSSLDEIEELAALIRAEAAPLPDIPKEIDQRIRWSAQQNAARVRRELAEAAQTRDQRPGTTKQGPGIEGWRDQGIEKPGTRSERPGTGPAADLQLRTQGPPPVSSRVSGRSVQRWAIAASLLLGIGALVAWLTSNQAGAPSPAPPLERAGVRASQLDIVDALVLARRLEAAQPGDQRYDLDHDGRADAADVERIARQAVVLGDA